MTPEAFAQLTVGDLVRHVSHTGPAYVVSGLHSTHVTAVRTVNLANPAEWEIVRKVQTIGVLDTTAGD